MSAILAVNGIELPISVDTLSCSLEEVGESKRMEDGSLVVDRRAEKRVYDFELSPMPAAAALFLRDVLLGRGDVWAFDSHLYSSRGQPVAGTGYLDSTHVQFGAESLRVDGSAGQTATWPFTTGLGVTVFAWGYDSAWALRVASFREGSSAPDFTADVSSGGVVTAPGDWATYWDIASAGVLRVAPGVDVWLDDVWVIPRALVGVPAATRDAWLAGIAALALPKGPAPRLTVTGDVIDPSVLASGTAYLTARGEVSALHVMPLMSGGGLSKTEHNLTGRLTEV